MRCNFVPRLSVRDEQIYGQIVPQDHLLRRVAKVIHWEGFREQLESYYSENMGRPGEDVIFLLKLIYLGYHYNLTDRQVIERARTDLSFGCFLSIPLSWPLPDPSSLCVFRGRLGVEGFKAIFHQVVQQARDHGLVKDRLRIKDASHVIGNVAVPSALALVAQIRDKLLVAAEPFAAELVQGERVQLEMLREATKQQKPAEKLVTRVAHLREILIWADKVNAPEKANTHRAWQTFLTQRDLAHKILEDQENPKNTDRTISTADPDARLGKHGGYYKGYSLDISIDADSEFITSINVLSACGDEAADAVTLIQQEEEAHGNDVQALSIDGVGFNGPVLRELQDPQGLNVDTYVPVRQDPESGLFTPQDFKEDKERGVVTCPAGQTSATRSYVAKKKTTTYRFSARVCRDCPLIARCTTQTSGRHGRTVAKSDYQAEHQRAREKTLTPQYAEVRREHFKVERKLGEIMNRHGGRRARYRSLGKVLIQELMACTATNMKRLVRLLCPPAPTALVGCTN